MPFSSSRTQIVTFLPENDPKAATATPNPGNPDIPSDSDETQLEMTETTENSPISTTSTLLIDTSQQTPAQKSTNPLQRLSRAVGQILTPIIPSPDTQRQSQPSASDNFPNIPTQVPNTLLTDDHHSRPTRQESHPTFKSPPIHETFFDNNDANDNQGNDKDKPPQLPLASPDALTSSTRTNFTYPPIEDVTRLLLKYAKTVNLWKLSYPTDLLLRC